MAGATLAIVLGIAAMVTFVGIRWAAGRADALAVETQRAQVLGTLNEYQGRLRAAATAELVWDEAVLRLDHALDAAWVDSSISQWLADTQGIERVVVHDADDRPLYAAVDGERVDPATEAFRCGEAALLDQVREAERQRGPLPEPRPDHSRLIAEPIDAAQYGTCHGGPVILVATLVQPDYGRTLPQGDRSPIVVSTKRLDGGVVERLAATLLLGKPRFEPPRAMPPGAKTIGLHAPDGREVARLAWSPNRPGLTLLAEAAPFAAVAMAALVALAAAAHRRLRNAQAMVEHAATRARRTAESLERMSALSRTGAFEWDPESRSLDLSRESARILGLPRPGSHPAAAVFARLSAHDAARIEHAFDETGKLGSPFDLPATTIGERDDRRMLRVQGRRNAAGSVEGMLQDITDEVLQGEAQRRTAELLERMSRIANIGGWEYDVARDLLTFTMQSYRIYGIPLGTPVDLGSIAAFYAPEDAQLIRRTVAAASREGTTWELELSPTTHDGRRIWVRGRGEAETSNGRVLRLFGTLQETTVAHQAEARLRDAVRHAEERNAEVQQFTFAASHDLQEPVRKVQALGSLLLARHGEQLESAAIDCIQRMQRSCDRMARLIDDVLAYARTAQRPLEPRVVSLATLVREVLEDLETQVEASKARVVVSDLPEIDGDAISLRRLLQNLLSNALKYRHPDRTPRAWIHADHFDALTGEPWIRLEIEDNGVGFDERHAKAVFLPFTRLDADREGSGIGLAIVRRIAEAHGGRVYAIGWPGRGARFVVELPVRQATSLDRRSALPSGPA